ncbi:MAG: 50S ribosomal protein L22 [Clostridia bacterium]|nr:50S ribosomal protein L22 [Clostridia bacterium]
MGKKKFTEAELLEKRDELIAAYNAKTPKSKKPAVLTKRERKALGIGRDQGKATLKFAGVAPRKAKLVLDLIKGKSVDEAYAIVRYTPKAASEMIYKLIRSAEANAVNNFGLNPDKLYVAEAYANSGSILKRMQPVSRGRGNRINKRTSHITVVLKEKSEEEA